MVTWVKGPPASSSLLEETEKTNLLQPSEVFSFVLWTQPDAILIAMGSVRKLFDLSLRAHLELSNVGVGTQTLSTTKLALQPPGRHFL